MYYLNYFFIMSILGHIIEIFIYQDGKSGILFLPWTPVYGFGTIIILFIYKFINKYCKNKFLKIFYIFLFSSISLTIIEFISGYFIQYLFNITFWDYSNLKFHIGKYISLEMAIIWGFASIFLIYYIKPLLDKIISKIPKFLTYSLLIIIIIDFIYTLNLK